MPSNVDTTDWFHEIMQIFYIHDCELFQSAIYITKIWPSKLPMIEKKIIYIKIAENEVKRLLDWHSIDSLN